MKKWAMMQKIGSIVQGNLESVIVYGERGAIINTKRIVGVDEKNWEVLIMVEIKNDGMMWALVKEKPEKGLWMKTCPNSRSWAK